MKRFLGFSYFNKLYDHTLLLQVHGQYTGGKASKEKLGGRFSAALLTLQANRPTAK